MADKKTGELTKREQETLDEIRAAGKDGIDFATLKENLRVGADGTLRPRLSTLIDMGKIKSQRDDDDARKARYFVVGKA